MVSLQNRLVKSRLNRYVAVFCLPISLVFSGSSAYGFDGSDTEVPRLEQMSLANTTALKPNEPVAIVLKTSDDKNWVKIEGTLNIGFSYRLLTGRNTPPNCATVTTTFSRLEAIEIISLRTTLANARKNQTFWLVGYLPAKKDLVSNCAEYRDLSLPPVVTVNSSSFRSVTPRGSAVPTVTGGIFVPKLTDESGRSALTVQTQLIQESRFWPSNNNYSSSSPCLTYVESATFREKNKVALDQYDAEVKAANDLDNLEGKQLAENVTKSMQQIDSWLEFAAAPSIEKLKAVPSCSVAGSSSSVLKSINDSRLKIKSSNALLVKSNLAKRCQTYQENFLKLEQKVLDTRTQYLRTTASDSFARFSYISLKVDCASSQVSTSLLDARESGLNQAEADFDRLIQLAISKVFCEPFNERLKLLTTSYQKATQKFEGSRFEKQFAILDLKTLFSACGIAPLDKLSIELMEIEFEAFASTFSINLEDAEKLLKAKKLTFKISCTKSSTTRVFTNKTGKCPAGYKRMIQGQKIT
jgi:hypothetical protein